METSTVALDNSRVLTVKLGCKTSLIAYSTDKRRILQCKLKPVPLPSVVMYMYFAIVKMTEISAGN